MSRPLSSTVHPVNHVMLLGSSVEANCRNIRKHREANRRRAITHPTQRSPGFHLCWLYSQTLVNDVLGVSYVPKVYWNLTCITISFSPQNSLYTSMLGHTLYIHLERTYVCVCVWCVCTHMTGCEVGYTRECTQDFENAFLFLFTSCPVYMKCTLNTCLVPSLSYSPSFSTCLYPPLTLHQALRNPHRM